MNRPKILHVGRTLYWTIRTRDPDTQVLKDADSTPTVAIRKNGASTGDSVTVTKRTATTGTYDCSYNPAGEAECDEFTVEESATVTGTTTGSATYSASWEFTVLAVERGTDSAALASGVNVTQWGGTAVASVTINCNMTQISGDATAADNAESFFDGTGYDGTNNTIPKVTTVTDGVTVETNNDKTGYSLSGTTTTLDALQTALDSAHGAGSWATATGFSTLDAAGVRTAVGLSSANLDTQLTAIAGYIDTEVAAIKAKTDNLPAYPADASDIAASFASIAASIATLTGYVDTEVAAIKAKTDNLPSDPADQSAVEAAITAAASLLATAAELAKVPKVGQTHRFTQVANNSGAKTADVSISVIP